MPRSRPPVVLVVLLTLLMVVGTGLGASSFLRSARAVPTTGVPADASHLLPQHARADESRPVSEARTARLDRAPARPAGGPVGMEGAGPMIFPPNPDRFRVAPGAGLPSSVYAATPAPMGVSDFGVGAKGSYSYGTVSFEGSLDLTSFSAFTPTNSTNLSYPSPDWVLLQLSAVAVNVTLPPAAYNGTFWVQNGVHFNGSAVQLEDNVWNFSSSNAALPSSTLEGSHGSILDGEVYSAIGPEFTVTLPVTIVLYDNITTVNKHTVVRFGYSIGSKGGTYDNVTFNGSASATSPSEFLVNGSALNPAKLLYDTEFVLGGNGDGTNANVVGLDATMSLSRWNTTADAYGAVPAAFDFGADSSETALGVAVAYTGTTAKLTAGPSFLMGLWNTNGATARTIAPSASPGWIEVQLTVDPSYAILFATNSTLAAGPLAAANYSYAPTNRSGSLTTDLPIPSASNKYVFAAWANGFTTANVTVVANSTTPTALTLVASPSTIDAPVYLLGSGEAAAFAAARIDQTGYSASRSTLWINASVDLLAAPFLRTNELDYPTFPLVAAVAVNLSIVANGFVQAPSTYNYTDEAGRITELANWSQGYFFYYGSGKFTVENTTIEGNTTLEYAPTPTFPPSTVEFYHTTGGTVANLTAVQDAVGVTIESSSSTRVTSLLSETGSLGVYATGGTGITISHASASGIDRGYVPSTLVELLSSSTATVSQASVADLAHGISAEKVSNLAVSGLTVTADATGLNVNASDSGSVTGLTVGGGGNSAAGGWSNSTALSFASIEVNGTGLNLSHDSSVTVTGGSATQVGSAVVSSFVGSTQGTFRQLKATDGADGVTLVGCTDVNVSSITSTNGSVGAFVANASTVSGTGYVSSNLSIGLLANNTSSTTFSSFTTSDQSIGAYVANSTTVKLSSVVATNATLSSIDYFNNSTDIQSYPVAGVGIVYDSSVKVSGVTAVDYPFAVWSDNSTQATVTEVTARYGYEAVSLNWTNSSKVTEVFAFAEGIGLSLQNSTGTTVGTSTFELSTGVGLTLGNGSRDTILHNNFIGNNGSSVNGTFNSSHPQAYEDNTTDATFEGNYWADRTGSAAYVVYNSTGPSTKDLTPLASFYPTYLEFNERGLPAGWGWTVTVGGAAYTMNVSLLYIPGWALSNGSVPFVVTPVVDYPAHPSSGSLSWDASSLTQSIIFGSLPSSHTSLPYWLIGVVVAGVLVAVLILVWRRGGPGQQARARARNQEWSPDEPAQR